MPFWYRIESKLKRLFFSIIYIYIEIRYLYTLPSTHLDILTAQKQRMPSESSPRTLGANPGPSWSFRKDHGHGLSREDGRWEGGVGQGGAFMQCFELQGAAHEPWNVGFGPVFERQEVFGGHDGITKLRFRRVLSFGLCYAFFAHCFAFWTVITRYFKKQNKRSKSF